MKADPTTAHARNIADITAGAKIRIDVGTQGGQLIMQMIEAMLAERMMEMAKADPQCRGLLNVLEQIGSNIQIAVAKSAKLLKEQAMGERE